MDALLNEPSTTKARTSVDLFELLVWTFRTQKADRILGRALFDLEAQQDDGYEPHGCSSDGIAAIERIGLVGCRIDVSSSGGISTRVHPDAARVVELIDQAARDWGDRAGMGLVLHHARTGEPPDLPIVTPRPFFTPPEDSAFRMDIGPGLDRHMTRTGRAVVPDPEDEGRTVTRQYAIQTAGFVTELAPVYERQATGGRNGRGGKMVRVGTETRHIPVEYCPVRWWPDPTLQDMDRAIYARWVELMRRLWDQLRYARLTEHELSGFIPPHGEPEPLNPIHDAQAWQVARDNALPGVAVTPGQGAIVRAEKSETGEAYIVRRLVVSARINREEQVT